MSYLPMFGVAAISIFAGWAALFGLPRLFRMIDRLGRD